MKYSFSILFGLMVTFLSAQDFYNLTQIQKIEITFTQTNWDQLLDAAYAADGSYIMAKSVKINGIQFDSVGVKYKGNSTYNPNQTKNPFHIELDTYKEQDYEGYTDIKLSNVSKDPSFLREVLSYQIIRQYMDAPLSNYANVYVNDKLIGLYSNSESVTKKFVNSRFGSKNNTFVKCNPPDGAGPNSTNLPKLVYLSEDSSKYYSAYELKSDYGWNELIDLCDTLKNHPSAIDKMLDVDRALWMIALNNVMVNLDSYIGAFAQNYYLYRDDYGRFIPVIWDLNESFGRFSSTGSGNLSSTAAKRNMSHLLQETNSNYPLVQKLLSVPLYKRMYLAHYKTILLENFDNNSYYDKGLALQNTIKVDVQADPNKFYTYANFTSNLTTDVTSGGSAPGITSLMDGRNDYLLALTDFKNTEPAIANIISSNTSPVLGDVLTINTNITNANAVYLGYRSEEEAPFKRVVMFDDGAHNDGAANDGKYGVDLLVNNTFMQYYIYAENNNIGKFSPARAEYEYHTITATIGNPSLGDLVINEFMASNSTSVKDPNEEFEDWIELHNNGTSTINLSGYFLSDDETNPTKWAFPTGTTISPKGYLIIWADEDQDQAGLHANFKLSASGEEIVLSKPDFTVVDLYTYTQQTADISFARIPNGTGDFKASTHTFNANNNAAACTNFGGDADEDGICAVNDCNDNNASIGAIQPAGTGCNDGLATTANDVIQADGCTCSGTTFSLTDLVINEIMASNETIIADQNGEFEDWIELFNNGTTPINLEGFFLSDTDGNPTKWTFPAGAVIGAKGYLIIWADEDQDQSGLHANFKLSASAESVFLSKPSGEILDGISYTDQVADISYGRFPNGTGAFRSMTATHNAVNVGTVSAEDTEAETFTLLAYPNPVDGTFYVAINDTQNDEKLVSIYSICGKLVYQSKADRELIIDASQWESGMYIVRAKNLFIKIVKK